MKVRIFLLVFCFFIIAAIPRLLSLDAHWASDEARWLQRSTSFMSAVKKGEFSETLIAYHPGVTTMWITGFRTFFTAPRLDLLNLASARWFIGVIIAAGISLAYFLLCRLFGKWIALASFLCLAFSPFFLAQTRRVHTDALATIFILLTALLFLIYCRNQQQRRMLVVSGVAFGLALLSKSYALILLPWIPLCLFLFRNNKKHDGRFLTYLSEMLCFFNCAALTVLTLWPIFWTPNFGIIALGLLGITVVLLRGAFYERSSIGVIVVACIGLGLVCVSVMQTVWNVFDRVNWAVTTPHDVEHFFLGKVVNDPGWLFYPFVLTIKSTPLMLPLAMVGCILLWKRRKHSEESTLQVQTVLSLIAFVVFFTFCLSITSKKFPRYLLPTFLMLEILAAIGFVEILKWTSTALRSRLGKKETGRYNISVAVFACAGFFFVQILPVLALHPYYGTYYNLCWKVTDITNIITVGSDASGVDLAAKYLNKKDAAGQMRIQVSYIASEFLYYYFDGTIHYISPKQTADSYPNLPIMYEVIYLRDSQIGWAPQEGLKGGKLEHVINLNGIDLVWIYRVR